MTLELRKRLSVEDTVLLQKDINKVFNWAEENNMEFDEEKFQLIRYGTCEDIECRRSI